ncbi:MAG TPA: 2-amino-4-hydroxy-6-hydroxymethyldihydropteridine diphosphokinase [Candidatus Udaeobacter sp.]|nr:2-amino-4-hydroxy-6-hydroxymethyldihydropteridine diphosphokinase [Candidatus Udaeobacter sp.]
MRTAVGLGSNLGNRLENLRTARRRILEIHGVHPPVFSSGIYETEPVNCEAGASKFLNAVIEFEFDGDPIKLLEETSRIEESLGRDRHHAKNVSRTIDIDLLYFGEYQIHNERLRLPHPRMHLREFVLQPLSDIRPDLILPNQRQTIRRLLAQCDPAKGVVPLMKDW